MDNARNAAQVRQLIPPRTCALLLTSRLRFALPGLRAKTLDALTPGDAKALLLAIAPRIDDEAERIADLCGRLPLALRLAATALAERSDLLPSDYARRLRQQRLKFLAASGESVEASISLSYDLLDPELQKRWRTLAVFPHTFNALAAGAIWEMLGTKVLAVAHAKLPDTVEDILGRLLQYSMVEWNETAKRYRLHDLMRDYARARSEVSELDAAAQRHAAYYHDVLLHAESLYLRGRDDKTKRGLALFDIEWNNIQAGQAWAALHAKNNHSAGLMCGHYPEIGVYCLTLRHPCDRIRWLEAAILATSKHDQHSLGYHLGNLGSAHSDLGQTQRAIECTQQYLDIMRDCKDRRGESIALGNLGSMHSKLGETRQAIKCFTEALTIAREVGEYEVEGRTLCGLGKACADLGKIPRAIKYCAQAVTIAKLIPDQGRARRVESTALSHLGNCYSRLEKTHRAIEYYERALAISRDMGNRRDEGTALFEMSLVLFRMGEHQQAIQYTQVALEIYEEIEHPNTDKVRAQLNDWLKF